MEGWATQGMGEVSLGKSGAQAAHDSFFQQEP